MRYTRDCCAIANTHVFKSFGRTNTNTQSNIYNNKTNIRCVFHNQIGLLLFVCPDG